MSNKKQINIALAMIAAVAAIALGWASLPVTPVQKVVVADAAAPVKLTKSAAYSPFSRVGKATDKSEEPVDNLEGSVVKPAQDRPLLQDRAAVASFAESALVDDPRAPPIVHRPPREAAPQEILEDPVKYGEYEAQKRRESLKRFVGAAKSKLKRLNRLIAEGKQRGISAQKLAEGIAKVKALQQGIEIVERDIQQ